VNLTRDEWERLTEDVRNRADIVKVVQASGVELKKAGR
jgi:hypothetical protein